MDAQHLERKTSVTMWLSPMSLTFIPKDWGLNTYPHTTWPTYLSVYM